MLSLLSPGIIDESNFSLSKHNLDWKQNKFLTSFEPSYKWHIPIYRYCTGFEHTCPDFSSGSCGSLKRYPLTAILQTWTKLRLNIENINLTK